VLTRDGPKVLEFNVRMGDPETQPILYRLEGTDFADVLLAAANGNLDGARFSWKQQSSVCVVLASAGYPGPFKKGLPITGRRSSMQARCYATDALSLQEAECSV
jgi:phosphoribosylamine--glycine ligase